MSARVVLRRLPSLLLVLAILSVALPPLAASAAVPAYRGEYYNNRDLSGAPSLVRDDAAVNFDWGAGSPAGAIHADDFSVRWTNFVSFSAGTYRFTVTVDDGVRLWIDDALVIDHWVLQPATTYTADRTLAAGYHSLRLEYFEAGGQARISFGWALAGSTPSYPDWKGEYYTNASLLGSPSLTRNDTSLNFNWGSGSPAASIPADNFSVRWTRQANFATAGTYTFSATADDGIRVKVDSTWVINRWVDQSATTTTGSINLSAGAHTVVVEYYERGGLAVAQVSWALGGGSSSTVVVDDLDPGFTRGGDLDGFVVRYAGYNNHLFWVWNNTTTAYYWGRWTPQLQAAGDYEVQVFVARIGFGTTSARYRIYHNGARDDRIISQEPYYDQWVSLGTYHFSAGGGEYVFLASNTGEPYATCPVGYDAVRFIGQGGTTPPPPVPTNCSITPVLGFGDFWRRNATVRNALGCPKAVEHGQWMGEETFIGGKMFWRQDADKIYVLYKDGTWQGFADTWEEGDPSVSCSNVAPSGYYLPVRGFGKLWCGNSTVRNRLSWGTAEEHGSSGAVQPFEHGLMIWSPALGIYALADDGRWYRF